MSRQQARAEGRAMGPAAVFAILLAVVAVGAAAMLMRSDPPEAQPAPSPQGTPSPTDQALTDAEAIARFEYLNGLRRRALQKKDARLLEEAFTQKSPAARRLRKSIATLQRNNAFAREKREVIKLGVISNKGSEIKLQETILLDVIFTDAEGKDITTAGGLERQRIVWTLKFSDGQWLIHDGSIEASRLVE